MDKKILRDLSYGVYIVTSKDNDLLVGCVANSIMQINSDTIAVSLNKENYTTKTILKNKTFAINVLNENNDPTIIGTFGFNKSNEVNKFQNINYDLIEDTPIIQDTCGYIILDLINTLETETHIIILGKIKAMQKLKEDTPMTYKYYQEKLKGKTSKFAPTYQEEKKEEESTNGKHIFVCKICGYEYVTDLEELPDDFKCPICGVGKEYFEKLR